jgi:hypothetical protein
VTADPLPRDESPCPPPRAHRDERLSNERVGPTLATALNLTSAPRKAVVVVAGPPLLAAVLARK